jgi:hypothetical protein
VEPDSNACARYESAVEALISHFTEIDKAADTLPPFTAMPYVWLIWAVLKFEFALLGDLILLVPINIVTSLRNLLPGRWRYTCWSCKYFKAVGTWVWNGECTLPFICVRPLATFLLHQHFRNRLSVLRRRLLLETSLSEEGAKAALAKVDRARAFWATASFGTIMLAWVLPLIGPAIELAKLLVPVDLPGWSRTIGITTIGYVLNVLLAAFIVKLGLMLGASGPAALYPGFLSGAGGYKREREILQPLGLALSEFPLDAALLVASLVFGLITFQNQMELYQAITPFDEAVLDLGQESLATTLPRFATPALYAVYAVGIVIALARRKKLGRA